MKSGFKRKDQIEQIAGVERERVRIARKRLTSGPTRVDKRNFTLFQPFHAKSFERTVRRHGVADDKKLKTRPERKRDEAEDPGKEQAGIPTPPSSGGENSKGV